LTLRTESPMPPEESGLLGARRRWGPPRIVRLADFPADERAAIVAAIDAKRAAREAMAAAGLQDRTQPVTDRR
jgi:hypothetical protein